MVGKAGSGDEPFGALLRNYRAAANMTQEELAERSGLSVHAIGMLERGIRLAPRASTVDLLAEALKLDASQRQTLVTAARRKHDSPAPAAVIPPELRAFGSRLIGRERELARARALLTRPDVRLLTLTGSPGAGKTRLALELATQVKDDYEDGVAIVTLGPLGDPGLVLPALRQALGLREVSNEAPLDTLARHCHALHVLLVLDNFEHLLDAGPSLVELLSRCPRARALVTSRAAMRLRGEHELPVPPLDLPSAEQERTADPDVLCGVASVRLFLERAEAAVPGFRLNAQNAPAVAAVCRRLDGLPLALELAAPWLKLLRPSDLLDRLDHRLELLVTGPRDLPERQRTLRATLDWSCGLLDEAPRALLRRLSVFSDGAPLDGLERVCQAAGALPGGVLPHMAVLLQHSLVHRQEAAGEPRVMMLETVREYGRELLAAAGELEATAQAHLDHYVRLTGSALGETGRRAQAAWLERLRREHDNVRAALAWAVEAGRAEAGLHLAGGLRLFWYHGGHRHEGLSVLERLLAVPGPVRPAVRAAGLRVAGSLAAQVGSYELAIARLQESLAIFRELDDKTGVADSLRLMAEAVSRRGDQHEAIRLVEEAVSLLRGANDRPLLATALMNLGVYVSGHDPGRATVLYEETLAITRSVGDALGTAICLINLAERARANGDLERSEARLREAADVARRLHSWSCLAAALVGLGDLDRTRGCTEAAGARYREGLALSGRMGEPRGIAVCLRRLAWLAWSEGRLERAARLYGASDALCPGASAVDSEAVMHEENRAAVRQQLGGDLFNAAYEAGGRLSAREAAAEGCGA